MFSLPGSIYGRLADLRNTLYDRGIFKTHPLGVKTISVGNITAGGTGKTPLVARVAEILAEKGETVCILTRGYGRKNPRSRVLVSDAKNVLADAATGGDEPVELARKLIGKAIVVADADRVSAAKWALDKYGITVFVLDDGFQHRRVKRNLDIICVDATNPFGNGGMLPTGILREPLENLKRADVIVLTRANLVEDTENLKSQISDLNRESPIFLAENKISRVIKLEDFNSNAHHSLNTIVSVGWEQLSLIAISENPEEIGILAFCALGNPNNFFIQLEITFDEVQMGLFHLSIIKTFPDHHFYTQQDIAALEKQARECNISAFVTTAKDAVKLKGLKFSLPCFVIEIQLVLDDYQGFHNQITSS